MPESRVDHILKFFHHEHLPQNLVRVSMPFCELAHWLVRAVPQTPERTVALRKLLECKDAAVRAALESPPGEAPPAAPAPPPDAAGDAGLRAAFDALWAQWMDGDVHFTPREIFATLRRAEMRGDGDAPQPVREGPES